MGSLTIENLPDDIHDVLRLMAAKNGLNIEAEARGLIIKAVTTEARLKPGDVMASIWRSSGMTAEEATAIDVARSREPAVPLELS
jgi:antitoxin FitA